MIKTVLIANRSEIACRIIRSARKMGLKSVAVYSEADRTALHVEMADEAVCIGGAPASESYLCSASILDACRCHQVDAVHPGYGFFSENAPFARAVERAGMVFVGPKASCIAQMGDKTEARRIAQHADVAVLPASSGPVSTLNDAIAEAQRIGFPVMLKAAGGGGGKGMRRVEIVADLENEFYRARSEADRAFGDDRIYLEKLIPDSRHIEAQIIADSHGQVVYLGERDCSLQRRNQKLLEESPVSRLSEGLRVSMREQVLRLARVIGYRSAGTIEFLVDGRDNFYFLEMNTRLQVEHAVTEARTGIDIVEWMFRIANDEALPLSGEEISFRGHAIEARICAEDPCQDFLPSAGHLRRFRPPELEGVSCRLDSGVREGDRISPLYDPMFAKVIVHADDREQASRNLAHVLDGMDIEGVATNCQFLSRFLRDPLWNDAKHNTQSIDRVMKDYERRRLGGDESELRLAAAMGTIFWQAERSRSSGGGNSASMNAIESDQIARIVRPDGSASFVPVDQTLLDGLDPIPSRTERHVWSGYFDSEFHVVNLTPVHGGVRVRWSGLDLTIRIFSARAIELMRYLPEPSADEAGEDIYSNMHGIVRNVYVAPGSVVEKNSPLFVLEAMKMENLVRSPGRGTVKEVYFQDGGTVSKGSLVVSFCDDSDNDT